MRMALILKLLSSVNDADTVRHTDRITGYTCKNKKCITKTEQELVGYTYINSNGKHACIYCDSDAE
jgi:aspartate carbamoyltransferase regulatory subunit